MSGDSIAQLIYLGTFALVLGGGFLLSSKLKLSQTLQMAAIWALIFIGAIGVVGLWGDIQDDLLSNQTRFDDSGTVTIPRSFDGHYYLTLDINGQPTDFIVDTGATDIVLNRADAEAAGLDPANLHFLGRAATANGEVRTAPVRLDSVIIGPHEDTNVPAVVNDGELGQSLLGMGYLQRWGRIEIFGGEMTLSR
ncbi:TIGR02281 family clan AA aspartic protease [Tateyamaria omphalii]|uniref:retropepsin-like aspartic protease family protein n=1 Tax=Tateyamaria omphalii TaxID=299262 RepID=UPI001C98EEA3|nr:TIGR02281 family clan AA aspartic protease [Tateyamaria omphalii]MBY5932753.1 TIGR02281 family clan AA aspartic protease [Tateyamaria omphalii]